MPTDRPTAVELLEAVREFLNDHIAPNLEEWPAFQIRIATNVLAIVERTITQGGDMDVAELSRLRELLGQGGTLQDLNDVLSHRIRAGEMDHQREAVLDHLRQTALDKVRLANPRYLTPRDE